MKQTLIICTIILFASSLHAQTRDTLYLWPNEVPGQVEAKRAAIQSDDNNGDVIRLTEVTNPCLVVFEPEVSNHSGVGILVCPGGGYSILAVDQGGSEIAEWLNTLGYTAFVLHYRVPKKQQGALNDIQRAIRLVRSKASEFQLYPEKIGVMGFSAGGSLCARAATQFPRDSYEKTDSVDELSCRPNFAMLIYPAYLDQGENRSLTPELTIGEFTPPFFIFGTADDKHGNSSLVMTTALRDRNIPVELHFLAEGGHGYGLRKGNVAAETWPLLAEKWLTRMVKTNKLANHQRTMNFPRIEDYPTAMHKKKDLWVFMMAGQSNMAGRGFVEPGDTIPSERILTINRNNEIILAKEPLNFNEPSMSGLDCGLSFARQLLKQVPENVSILLVPTAVGGSSISQWLGDSIHREVQLLSNFHEKMTLAKTYGELKGILWHQGESDANEDCIPFYSERLTQLFGKFRAFAGNKSLPIIVGELGSYSKNKSNWLRLNEQIKDYVSKDNQAGLIHTSDLINRGDSLHFDSESQRIMGERFAEKYLQMAN